jgi:dTDP-4-amino-4,6-dideoxy-D-galactose acyltransferase
MTSLLPASKANTNPPGDAQHSLCRVLDWDSHFFGFGIASVNADNLDPKSVAGLAAWCKGHSISCLYLLLDSSDTAKVRLAEQNHFHMVDIRMTLVNERMRAATLQMDDTVRLAEPDDVPALKEIAGVSHQDSRFYSDPGFPVHLADELYRTWIEKSCGGYADCVLVAEHEGRPAGYISCHIDAPDTGRIGLLAVGPDAQGRGIGSKLVDSALHWFAGKGLEKVTVVTQGRNIAAQRLYQRRGFTTQSVQIWYHRWFREPSQGGT